MEGFKFGLGILGKAHLSIRVRISLWIGVRGL